MKQAVLGATGDVGGLLLNQLISRNIDVKALSRTIPDASKQIAGVEYAAADAESKNSLIAATRSTDVVYATLAVPYSTKSWQQSWPSIMRNLIDAAKANNFKLVFLDNVYMYGQADDPMTEDSPVRPIAKKGEVRAKIANMLLDAMAAGEVNATIGRSADFYGANTRMSSRFFSGTRSEGKAYWMGGPDVLRTWSYVPDNARALAILGNDVRADQKVWHLPAAQAMRGSDFISLASTLLGRELETVLVPGDSPQARQDFAASLPEIAEMMYQYDFDYVFDSSRFQEIFAMQPTSYEDGFRQVYEEIS